MTRVRKRHRWGSVKRSHRVFLTFSHVASKPVTVSVDSADSQRIIEEYSLMGWDLVE